MSADDQPDPGPWGIIVTRTAHLYLDRNRPACWNDAVIRTMDGYRARWKREPDWREPIFGHAGQRPTCKRCIAALRRHAARVTEAADEAEAWNAR